MAEPDRKKPSKNPDTAAGNGGSFPRAITYPTTTQMPAAMGSSGWINWIMARDFCRIVIEFIYRSSRVNLGWIVTDNGDLCWRPVFTACNTGQAGEDGLWLVPIGMPFALSGALILFGLQILGALYLHNLVDQYSQ